MSWRGSGLEVKEAIFHADKKNEIDFPHPGALFIFSGYEGRVKGGPLEREHGNIDGHHYFKPEDQKAFLKDGPSLEKPGHKLCPRSGF